MLVSEDETLALDAPRHSFARDIVELVVLTSDDIFLQTLREAVGASRRLWHIPTADTVSDLLIAGSVGILVFDSQALLPETAPAFITEIKQQFPDLVVIVAGTRDAETALASLISEGSVYRFIHKPMSPGRARLFADAAVKRYEQQRQRTGRDAAPAGAAMPAAKLRRHAGLKFGGACAALGVLIALIVGLSRHSSHNQSGAQPPLPAAASTQPAPADIHEQLMARAENALREQLAKSLEQPRGPALPPRPKEAPAAGAAVPAAAPVPEPAAYEAPTKPAEQAPVQREKPVQRENETEQPAASVAAEQPSEAAEQSPAQDRPAGPADGGSLAPQKPAPSVRSANELTLVKSVQPAYPRRAEQKGIEGWVDLEFTVAETGAVMDIDVRAAVPTGVFEQAAVGALSQWRYRPVVQDAKPTAQRARIRIRFALAH